jgi:nicotinate-nucleotide--dimethylbenzimidazole phosphoribosyltransferase
MENIAAFVYRHAREFKIGKDEINSFLEETSVIRSIGHASLFEFSEALRQKIAGKTKPIGSLGRIEEIAYQIGLIQNRLSPELSNPYVLVFAGDHGLAAEGVSAYPQDVTWQMVFNFLNGGAAISVFAREANLSLRVIDAGVNYDFPDHPNLINAKIMYGTRNVLHEPAMTIDQCRQALLSGSRIVSQCAETGCNIICLGEMGIGNTSAAALITSWVTGVPVAECVGKGTGVEDCVLRKKICVLEQASVRHVPSNPFEMLAAFGGAEIAMLVGTVLAAAAKQMIVIVDGFITTAAVAIAATLEPECLGYCIASHRSNERAHGLLLDWLELKPLLDLDMRLGEGTGAALAYPLIRSAVAFLNEMASFDSADVSTAIERE